MPDLTKMSREEKRLWLAGMAISAGTSVKDAVRVADALLEALEA